MSLSIIAIPCFANFIFQGFFEVFVATLFYLANVFSDLT